MKNKNKDLVLSRTLNLVPKTLLLDVTSKKFIIYIFYTEWPILNLISVFW